MSDVLELPTAFLPPLRPVPGNDDIQTALDTLQHHLQPKYTQVVYLNGNDQQASTTKTTTSWDSFELSYARQWLTRLMATIQDDVLIEQVSSLLALLSGDRTESSETVFVLPDLPNDALLTPPDSRANSPVPPLSLKIRSVPSQGLSTGHVTWTSARLLAALLCRMPHKFFRPLNKPLRVLEIGSGTGLVGLAAATVLSKLDRPASVFLTDFDTVVLDNLRHNVESNRHVSSSSNVDVRVEHLDWSSPPIDTRHNFDVILAADVLYEPQHVPLLKTVISSCLRLDNQAKGVAWIAMPLRSTHASDYADFDRALGKRIASDDLMYHQGIKHRLVSISPLV